MDKKPLLREQLATRLREQILQLQTTSPVRIAPERTLAEQFGVSRISIRAAVKQLALEGLLSQTQGRGTYITPRSQVRTLHLFCSPDIKGTDPFYNEFLVEITTTAALQAMTLQMVHESQITLQDPHVPLVVIGVISDTLKTKLAQAYRTIIVVQGDGHLPGAVHLSFDDYAIGQRAAALFLESNYHKIALLSGPDRFPSANQRKQGFLDKLHERNLQPITITSKMNWSGGYHSASELESWLYQEDEPKALFAANDWMAVGLIQRFKEQGIAIPEKLAVLGCDNIQLAAQFTPSLSTFDLDMKLLTTELLQFLSSDAIPTEQESVHRMLPATLILRETFTP
ncbi:GntR family transcriptional regulator [Paenibacillus daejeonensis]|uniref:GntR family transcriptional regulator n=1 Tax=Paenibacillus daejeonensis TaxID=135193 RepID=UPI0003731602|nr:GntR family transcriptional regulator [Paenibacillus daejeonensis]